MEVNYKDERRHSRNMSFLVLPLNIQKLNEDETLVRQLSKKKLVDDHSRIAEYQGVRSAWSLSYEKQLLNSRSDIFSDLRQNRTFNES